MFHVSQAASHKSILTKMPFQLRQHLSKISMEVKPQNSTYSKRRNENERRHLIFLIGATSAEADITSLFQFIFCKGKGKGRKSLLVSTIFINEKEEKRGEGEQSRNHFLILLKTQRTLKSTTEFERKFSHTNGRLGQLGLPQIADRHFLG